MAVVVSEAWAGFAIWPSWPNLALILAMPLIACLVPFYEAWLSSLFVVSIK